MERQEYQRRPAAAEPVKESTFLMESDRQRVRGHIQSSRDKSAMQNAKSGRFFAVFRQVIL